MSDGDPAHMIRPCENCPYRMDAPRGHWSREEFEGVLGCEHTQLGSTYACHKQQDLTPEERGFCAGWLLDQKKRNLPSLKLRLELIRDVTAVHALKHVSAEGIPMFPTIKAMCRANGVRPR